MGIVQLGHGRRRAVDTTAQKRQFGQDALPGGSGRPGENGPAHRRGQDVDALADDIAVDQKRRHAPRVLQNMDGAIPVDADIRRPENLAAQTVEHDPRNLGQPGVGGGAAEGAGVCGDSRHSRSASP